MQQSGTKLACSPNREFVRLPNNNELPQVAGLLSQKIDRRQEARSKRMNGFVDVIAQLGALVLSLSIGLLIVWGSLAGLSRVFTAEQVRRVSALEYKSQGLERGHILRQL